MTTDGISSSPKKLLSLDGGGIRGLITVGVLVQLENKLRERLGTGPDFVLCDYFDYVGGTSTGAIIATCIACGMSAEEIRKFYLDSGREMFDRAHILKRLHYKYDDEPLAQKLRGVLREKLGEGEGKGMDIYRSAEGEVRQQQREPTLGNLNLKTLLMVVMRNVTTDSPWPLSNNPLAKYNDRNRTDCNLDLPLWKIVRASTAAPVYFPPEVVSIGSHDFIFVDGGVTPYNNPAFLLFLKATLKAYGLEWQAGVGDMLLVSIGTGAAPDADSNLRPGNMNVLYNATSLPGALMYGASNQQDVLCRVFGECKEGGFLDRDIEYLMGEGSQILGPGAQGLEKHFTYMRYNAELTRESLNAMGLTSINPDDVKALDSIDHLDALQAIGQAVGERQVNLDHFDGFLPTAPAGM